MASVDKGLKCQMCQFLHPTTFPKVCLELDCFLERQFPKEYASRRDVVQLKQACMEIENQTDCMSAPSILKLSAQLVPLILIRQ